MNVYVFRIYVTILAFIAAMLYHTEQVVAQTEVPQILENIQVSYKDTENGSAYLFMTEVPLYAKTWRLSIAEHNGALLFSDSGENWNSEGYEWIPDERISLYSGIFYIVTLSFISENGEELATKSSKFFTKITIKNNKAPLIFFRGNTVLYSSSIYNENTGAVAGLLDFIANQANNQYKENNILIRGHAAFVTRTIEARKKEQIELLTLSSKRSFKIITELTKRNVDSQRIIYEALGGSETLSENPRMLWKNRRVEIIFIPQKRNTKKHSTYKEKKINNELRTGREDSKPPLTPQEIKTASKSNKNRIINKEIEMPQPLPQIAEEEPWPDTAIMSKGNLTANELAAFLLYNSPALNTQYARRIASFYLLEASREKVNQDIAFAQMLLETDYLQFTGVIQKNQYNFANIGSVTNSKESNWFSTETIGVRAHVQHLKGYASTKPLNSDLVDPRYSVLEYNGLLGSSPLVSTLSGRWSADIEYGTKILRIMRRMYNFVDAWNKTKE